MLVYQLLYVCENHSALELTDRIFRHEQLECKSSVLLLFERRLGPDKRHLYRNHPDMYPQCSVFSVYLYWEHYYFIYHLQETRASFTAFHPSILPFRLGPFCGTDLSTMFRGLQYCRAFRTLQCVLQISTGTQTISSYITSGMSLVTLSGISIDRLLALTLHLRYNTVVTVNRIVRTVSVFWIVLIMVVVLRFWISEWIIFCTFLLLSTFVVTTLSTLKIFQIVRRHQRQITKQQQSIEFNTITALKCRKSAVTTIFVYGLFVFFYLPFGVTMLVDSFNGYTPGVKIAYMYTGTVVFINSFLNPLVYCWRITEVRRAVKNLLKKNWKGTQYLFRSFWFLLFSTYTMGSQEAFCLGASIAF